VAGAAQAALPLRARAGGLGRRLLALAGLAIALVALYMLWFRDSSLVAVKTVEVEGAATDGKLARALTSVAQDMTTLHVRPAELEQAAEPFALVESVSADPSFPSTLTIHVNRRDPAALIGAGSGAVAVADDGTILRGLPAEDLELPRLPLDSAPKRERLSGPVRDQVLVLGATPGAIRPHVESSFNGEDGVGVELAGGVELRFGDAVRAADKWRAAAAVLADPELGPLDYVDLRVPQRPAVGGVGHSPPSLSDG
jgi:cell division septal protein FtsQ